MNKKIGYYFSKGKSEAVFAYRKLSFKNKLSLMMYFLVSFIGKIFFFTRPVFAMADQNIGKMISETRDFSLSQAFHGVNDSKRYLGLLGTYFVKDLTLIGVIALAFFPFLSYGGFEAFYSEEVRAVLTERNLNDDMLLVLEIIGIVISSFAVVVSNLDYAGAAYVGAFLPNPETSDILHITKVEMKGSRSKILGQIIVQFLVCGILGVVVFVGTKHLYKYPDESDMFYWPLIGLGMYLVWIFFTMIWFTRSRLSGLVTRYEIYKDVIVLKKPIAVKEVIGEEEGYASLFKDDEKELEALSISQLKKKEEK